jgi:hypothetical protein
VVVEAKRDASSAWSTVADALKMADIAFKEVLADPLGQRAVASDLDRIVIREGGHAAITLADRALTIEIDAATPVVGPPPLAASKPPWAIFSFSRVRTVLRRNR